ncbi:MAG: 30S ribosomal protein S5 [Candidatus Hydrothermae bacterium]|nr:30S ribosomal protein S5 [Candidatus Hydrothermae bacterium]
MAADFSRKEGVTELIETVVTIKRVAKVTKGGRNFKLSAWVVVGDGNGRVGIGHGKASETPDAIQKATKRARKSMVKVVITGSGTLPHDVIGEMGASRVLLKPAAPGTGIIAPQPVRAVLEAAGYKDVLTKSLGSHNAVNLLKATLNGLLQLKDPEKVAKERGIPISVIQRRFYRVQKAEDKNEEELHREAQEG